MMPQDLVIYSLPNRYSLIGLKAQNPFSADVDRRDQLYWQFQVTCCVE